ncbi:MAG TPA: 5'-3' exonuclease H3TH domain-containing protein, partial [Verrucomicrobiae bacterium]|nr:5'-3' exonuclease H3TH domain-containing protein [Verrucomicrobiae bacterium]
SKGVNTSALYGFTQTLLEILKNQQPTHIAVAFDTEAPTHRHTEFADYKATRQTMPEDLSLALPHVERMLEAFRIPVLTCDGYEADDIIGTIVRRAEKAGFKSYMVTPDKDFGQLIDDNTFLYKPARMGDAVEVMGLPEIRQRWGVERPEQVVDVLALMGDSSDNIPGVPGIGEKTAMKLIGQFGSVENLLEHRNELAGRVKETLEKNAELAALSKRLATIHCDAPCPVDLDALQLKAPDDEKLKALLVEFEFNSIGRRIFGEEFKAGRGFQPATAGAESKAGRAAAKPEQAGQDLVLALEAQPQPAPLPPVVSANLKRLHDVPHSYGMVTTAEERAELIQKLKRAKRFAVDTETTSADPKQARLLGLSFSVEAHAADYVPLPGEAGAAQRVLEEFRPILESAAVGKVGHNLKFDVSVLKWHGISTRGVLFDTMVAHSLIEPEMRHGLDYMAEVYLGYTPIPITELVGEAKGDQISVADVPLEKLALHAAESADLALRLAATLEPLLKERGQERVFYEIEAPLIPVLVDMEYEGIRVDAASLADFAAHLEKEINELEQSICRLAGTTFNLNSPRQLGQILF